MKKKKIVVITPNFFPENFPINNFVNLLSKEEEVDVITNILEYDSTCTRVQRWCALLDDPSRVGSQITSVCHETL